MNLKNLTEDKAINIAQFDHSKPEYFPKFDKKIREVYNKLNNSDIQHLQRINPNLHNKKLPLSKIK
jgi:hypothetical protein